MSVKCPHCINPPVSRGHNTELSKGRNGHGNIIAGLSSHQKHAFRLYERYQEVLRGAAPPIEMPPMIKI